MVDTTEIRAENVYDFLKRFATDISLADLKPVSNRYQGGDSLTFYYRNDSILKVPRRNDSRTGLLKEAKLIEYLHTQPLPFVVAKPITMHEKGFYAMFSRIDGASLPIEAFEEFTPRELESFGRSVGSFLSFLHNHKFPVEVLKYIPRAEDPFEVALHEARRQLTVIEAHTVEVDTTQWTEKLESLRKSLDQRWTVVHCDLQINHLLFVGGNLEQLAIIDFADTLMHDPAVDLSEFAIEMYSDLSPDGVAAKKIIDAVLKHYQTDDLAIKTKIEFGLLIFAIQRAYQEAVKLIRP
jgi:aminoglycoside phosphotransferase (APT) family kinase protein